MIDQMSFESAVYVASAAGPSDPRKMVGRSNCDAMRQKMPDFAERFDPCYDSQIIALDIPNIWKLIL